MTWRSQILSNRVCPGMSFPPARSQSCGSTPHHLLSWPTTGRGERRNRSAARAGQWFAWLSGRGRPPINLLKRVDIYRMYYDFFCNRKALTPPQWRSWASEEDAMPSDSSNPFINRDDLLQLIRKEFTSLDPHYGEKRGDLLGALKAPADEVAARQQAGLPAACANQILLEISWLANYRDDWDRAKRRLVDLQKALAQPDKLEPTQDDEGSWGACCEEWYRKLEPTVDALQEVTDSTPKLKPLRFMEKLQDAQATLDLLYRLQITDIRNTRKNQRDELGAMQTALSQMIFKDGLRDLLIDRPELGFSISPELEASYTDYLQQTQHPRTGYWGPWYRFGERLVMVQDLAFTFHVINYRAG